MLEFFPVSTGRKNETIRAQDREVLVSANIVADAIRIVEMWGRAVDGILRVESRGRDVFWSREDADDALALGWWQDRLRGVREVVDDECSFLGRELAAGKGINVAEGRFCGWEVGEVIENDDELEERLFLFCEDGVVGETWHRGCRAIDRR